MSWLLLVQKSPLSSNTHVTSTLRPFRPAVSRLSSWLTAAGRRVRLHKCDISPRSLPLSSSFNGACARLWCAYLAGQEMQLITSSRLGSLQSCKNCCKIAASESEEKTQIPLWFRTWAMKVEFWSWNLIQILGFVLMGNYFEHWAEISALMLSLNL